MVYIALSLEYVFIVQCSKPLTISPNRFDPIIMVDYPANAIDSLTRQINFRKGHYFSEEVFPFFMPDIVD